MKKRTLLVFNLFLIIGQISAATELIDIGDDYLVSGVNIHTAKLSGCEISSRSSSFMNFITTTREDAVANFVNQPATEKTQLMYLHGHPDAGKTHLASTIATKFAEQEKDILWVSSGGLVDSFGLEKRIDSYDLIVIDNFVSKANDLSHSKLIKKLLFDDSDKSNKKVIITSREPYENFLSYLQLEKTNFIDTLKMPCFCAILTIGTLILFNALQSRNGANN